MTRRLTSTAIIALMTLGLGLGDAHAGDVRVFKGPVSADEWRAGLMPEEQAAPRAFRTRGLEFNAGAAPAATTLGGGPAASTAAVAPAAPAPRAAVAAAAAASSQPSASSSGGAIMAVPIEFDFDSADIRPDWYGTLDGLAQVLSESGSLTLVIEGHTDGKGSPGYNLDLSKRRAAAVRDYLVSRGVSPSRLTVIGKGMGEPLVADPADPANRRVQFRRAG